MFKGLVQGCTMCDVKYFHGEEEKRLHNESSRHKAHQLLRRHEVNIKEAAAGQFENITDVLRKFRHLPRLRHHLCIECGTTVITSGELPSIDNIANQLRIHLLSKEHKHVRYLNFSQVPSPNTSAELLGQLPRHSIALSESLFLCYACSPFEDFTSFLSLCDHAANLHAPNPDTSPPLNIQYRTKRLAPEGGFFSSPIPQYMHDNQDGVSRTCTLCNVIVWSDEDPHLSGKRHKKAIRNHYWYSENS